MLSLLKFLSYQVFPGNQGYWLTFSQGTPFPCEVNCWWICEFDRILLPISEGSGWIIGHSNVEVPGLDEHVGTSGILRKENHTHQMCEQLQHFGKFQAKHSSEMEKAEWSLEAPRIFWSIIYSKELENCPDWIFSLGVKMLWGRRKVISGNILASVIMSLGPTLVIIVLLDQVCWTLYTLKEHSKVYPVFSSDHTLQNIEYPSGKCVCLYQLSHWRTHSSQLFSQQQLWLSWLPLFHGWKQRLSCVSTTFFLISYQHIPHYNNRIWGTFKLERRRVSCKIDLSQH